MTWLVNQLEYQRKGCFVNSIFLECIFYAADMLLLSASVTGLKQVLNIYYDIGAKHDMFFHPRKSHCIKFGKNIDFAINGMLLHDAVSEWVDSFKHLGTTFILLVLIKLELDWSQVKSRFYIAINSVLRRCKYVDEVVRVHPVKTFCLPLLV